MSETKIPTLTVHADFENNEGKTWNKGEVLDTKEKIIEYYRSMLDFDCSEDDITEHAKLSDDRLYEIVSSFEDDDEDSEVLRCEAMHSESHLPRAAE
jgi:hypothetical protein